MRKPATFYFFKIKLIVQKDRCECWMRGADFLGFATQERLRVECPDLSGFNCPHQSLAYLIPVEYIEKELAEIHRPVLPMWSVSTAT